jgi:hypothetical protein
MDVDLSDQPGCHGNDGMDKLTCGIHLHGVGDGGVLVAPLQAKQSTIRLRSLDSALVSIGTVPPPSPPPPTDKTVLG